MYNIGVEKMKGIFDIVGPIMIGPSSSHTAGAVRLGLMAGKVLGEEVKSVEIRLHGSFAQTYRGHGTDRALIAGIMGFQPEDERIREALNIAKEKGIDFEFIPVDLMDAHPNTAIMYLTGVSGRKVQVQGCSIGGGNILITNIDGYSVQLSGEYPALLVVHTDRPGIVSQVTAIISRYHINVAFMRLSRKNRGESALMILETDDMVPDEAIEECDQVYDVQGVFRIPAM